MQKPLSDMARRALEVTKDCNGEIAITVATRIQQHLEIPYSEAWKIVEELLAFQDSLS